MHVLVYTAVSVYVLGPVCVYITCRVVFLFVMIARPRNHWGHMVARSLSPSSVPRDGTLCIQKLKWLSLPIGTT